MSSCQVVRLRVMADRGLEGLNMRHGDGGCGDGMRGSDVISRLFPVLPAREEQGLCSVKAPHYQLLSYVSQTLTSS